MDELARVRDAVKPLNVLLVLDAMTGQEAVNVAEAFQQRIAFDGVVLTKLDGDARGGQRYPSRRSPASPSSSRRSARSSTSSRSSIPTGWRPGSSAWATC